MSSRKILLSALLHATNAAMVANWEAKLVKEGVPEGKYKLVLEWDHNHDDYVTVDFEGDGGRVYKATDDPRCNGDSQVKAADGMPFWMPRFASRPVSQEITAVTGIKFASVDWQPCGHKDVTICHAESHYDMHLYYVTEDELAKIPECEIGSPTNPNLPVCHDDEKNSVNHDYFKLISDNMPKSMKKNGNLIEPDYCVDPTSAIMRSGVHYGDKSETLGEWKTPVTIIGSHDCRMLFFEPMVSWKWISDSIFGGSPGWPKFEATEIQYNEKTYRPLPDSWTWEVSEGCKADNVFAQQTSGNCHIKVTVIGDSCLGHDDCALPPRKCGNMKDCSTGEMYQTPWKGKKEEEVQTEEVEEVKPPAKEEEPTEEELLEIVKKQLEKTLPAVDEKAEAAAVGEQDNTSSSAKLLITFSYFTTLLWLL